jgi:hypothetical protein
MTSPVPFRRSPTPSVPDLPHHDHPSPSWYAAVALGASGRYLPAWIALDHVGDTSAPQPVPSSLVHSLRGSHLRQVGAVEKAAEEDMQALDLVVQLTDEHVVVTPMSLAAVIDARLGVAADGIAAGVADEATRQLHLVEDLITSAGNALDDTVDSADGFFGLWRLRTRFAWVSAELALLVGETELARSHAERACVESAAMSSRHRMKSEAIRAAVAVAQGDHQEASAAVHAVWPIASRRGWLSLVWPLALIGLAADPWVDRRLVEAGAHATRTIEAHLPVNLAGPWGARDDVGRLRAVAAG